MVKLEKSVSAALVGIWVCCKQDRAPYGKFPMMHELLGGMEGYV